MLGSDENNEIEKIIFVLGDLKILEKREKLRLERFPGNYNVVCEKTVSIGYSESKGRYLT